MSSVNLPIGSTNSGTNDWSDVYNNDKALADVVNGQLDNGNLSGSAGITGANIASATVADSNLVSPNNSAYRTLLTAGTTVTNSLGAGTYFLGGQTVSSAGTGLLPLPSPGSLTTTVSANIYATAPALIYFDDADYTVGSLTQKLRVKCQVSANGTQPTITFTFGLYPVTFSGGSTTLTATLGTVIAGSTKAIASPAASSTTQGNSGDFTVPADGQYALGVVTNGTLTTSNASLLTAQLQTRNV